MDASDEIEARVVGRWKVDGDLAGSNPLGHGRISCEAASEGLQAKLVRPL
jgi:hypothetical protein